MKKKITLLLALFICINLNSQTKGNPLNKTENNYIRLSLYKEIFSKKLTKKDSSKFKFSKGDTLVYIKNFKKLLKKYSKNKNASLFHRKMSYMPLKQYKKRHTKIITKEDSLHFKFKDNDTLILISNKGFYKNQKRISVNYEPKDSLFLEIYKDVVYKKFTNTGNLRKGEKELMRLWEKPLKIYFSPSLDQYYKKKIKKAAKKLSSIDSLNILFVKNRKASNYIIYQIDSENKFEYSKDLRNNKSVDYYIYWNKGKIYDAKLKINLTQKNSATKKANATLLVQNFYQTLGRFFTTSKVPKNSMLSNSNFVKKKLTKLDIEIISYHYSYGICKFTDLKTFEKNHKKAKEIIRKGGQMQFIHIY
jgi:CRISPR/Cas system-associated endoribonuclease Cas2